MRPSAHLTNGAHLPHAPEAQGPKPCAPLGIRNPMTGILKSPTSFLHARNGTFPRGNGIFPRATDVVAGNRGCSRFTKSAFHGGRIFYMLLCECVCLCVSLCLSLSLRTVVLLRLLVCAAHPGFLSYNKVKDLKQNACCRLFRSLCSSFSKAET